MADGDEEGDETSASRGVLDAELRGVKYSLLGVEIGLSTSDGTPEPSPPGSLMSSSVGAPAKDLSTPRKLKRDGEVESDDSADASFPSLRELSRIGIDRQWLEAGGALSLQRCDGAALGGRGGSRHNS